MASSCPITVETALQHLQQLVRRPPSGSQARTVSTRLLPKELVGGEDRYISLLPDEIEALGAAEAALLNDLRFEHLGRRVKDVVWHFAADCYVNANGDRVRLFVDQHGRPPVDAICYLTIECLKVSVETEILGIRLLPMDDPRIPPVVQRFTTEPSVRCVAAVGTRGTNYEQMAGRAHTSAAHTLRTLRIALREHNGIHNDQLRFRPGVTYAFEERVAGWHQREGTSYELEMDGGLVDQALAQPVMHMPVKPANDLQLKADIALRWIERAWFSTEPLVALLYLFFALEALLGDKSEKLKAPALAFRQAMLSSSVTGTFAHPSKTFFLYDRIRSSAVHGEHTPNVGWDLVRSFAWDVRRTLKHYLIYAGQEGFQRRSRLIKALDRHPDRPQLIRWIRQSGDARWQKYLKVTEEPTRMARSVHTTPERKRRSASDSYSTRGARSGVGDPGHWSKRRRNRRVDRT